MSHETELAIEIIEAQEEDRPLLANLLQFYLYDFSEFMSWDVPDNGRFDDDDLNGCWTEDYRHPYLLRVNGQLAGFAIVNQGSDISGDPAVIDMSEFFVMRKYRHRGVGSYFAVELFKRFPGQWEVRELGQNQDALKFWRNVIGKYTGGQFKDFFSLEPNRRPFYYQTFASAGVSSTGSSAGSSTGSSAGSSVE